MEGLRVAENSKTPLVGPKENLLAASETSSREADLNFKVDVKWNIEIERGVEISLRMYVQYI